MATNIKGITVEINGDTAPLNKALSGVNKSTRDLQSELRAVDKALKLDPKNTVLLEQKQKLLAESITTTKEKLGTLKIAEEQAQAKFAEGKISEEQYRALQREVIKTEAELKKLEKSATESNTTLNKVSEAADKIGVAGGKVAVVGVAAIGTALIGTAAAGILMGDELTKALNGVEAATGYSEESMSGMKDTMLNIYNNNFGEDFADIGKSIEEVAKQTGETGQELEDLTTNALMLRDTFEFEVTESTRSAKMIMDQFGASGNEAYNLIAQGAQWGLDKNGDLLDTINEYSATFKAQGFSAEEMFNMLQNGAASGTFSVDKLGDAMKEFGIRSKDGSKTSADGFKELGLDATSMTKAFAEGGESAKGAFEKTTEALFAMQDPVAQNTAGVALFGTQWEDLGASGIKALVETEGEISNTTDALKGINDVKYNSFGEGVEGIKRQLVTGVALPIGEEILPKLNEFSSTLKEKIPSIIASLTPIIDRLIAIIKFLAQNFNIIIPIIGVLAGMFATLTIINGITRMVNMMSGAFALLNIAKLKDIASTLILNALYVKDAIVKGASVIAQIALNVATAAWSIVCGIATAVTTGLGIAIAFLTSPIGLAIIAIVALVAGFIYLWNHCEGFRIFWISLWDGIKSTIKFFVDTLVGFLTVVIPGAFNAVLDFIKNNWQAILLFIVNPFAGALALLYNLNPQFRAWIDNVANTIVSGFNSAINFITLLPGQALQWGRDFIQGLIDGIGSMVGGIVDAVSGIAEKITSFLHFSVPDEGPLTDYESWMPDFMGGLAQGIKNSKSLVTDAVKGLSTDMSIGMSLSPAMLGVGSLGSTYKQADQATTQTLNNNNTIVVPINLDGKTVATATAPYSDRISGNNINLMNRGLMV